MAEIQKFRSMKSVLTCVLFFFSMSIMDFLLNLCAPFCLILTHLMGQSKWFHNDCETRIYLTFDCGNVISLSFPLTLSIPLASHAWLLRQIEFSIKRNQIKYQCATIPSTNFLCVWFCVRVSLLKQSNLKEKKGNENSIQIFLPRSVKIFCISLCHRANWVVQYSDGVRCGKSLDLVVILAFRWVVLWLLCRAAVSKSFHRIELNRIEENGCTDAIQVFVMVKMTHTCSLVIPSFKRNARISCMNCNAVCMRLCGVCAVTCQSNTLTPNAKLQISESCHRQRKKNYS